MYFIYEIVFSFSIFDGLNFLVSYRLSGIQLFQQII